MLAVRDGEISKLGDLFERYHRPLYGFFYRLTGERTLSEDLVQQVFYRIMKYRHTYQDEGKFSAWMYHLARRVLADHFRRHKPTAILEPEELDRVPDDASDAVEQTARADDLRLMQKAFHLLPVDEREILTLHRFQHLAHQEIARLLDCSVSAAKVRLHRALKTLRDKYQRLSAEETV
jgi:RNA polymerase sigma factor (sigma-70 family)